LDPDSAFRSRSHFGVFDRLAALEGIGLAIADLETAFPKPVFHARRYVDLALTGIGDGDAVVPGLDLVGVRGAFGERLAKRSHVVGGRPPLDRIDHDQQVGVELAAIDGLDDRVVRPRPLLLETAVPRFPIALADEALERFDIALEAGDPRIVEIDGIAQEVGELCCKLGHQNRPGVLLLF
jgi:hypothetical protein